MIRVNYLNYSSKFIALSSMATIKLNWSICRFYDCIDKTSLTRIDWEKFEEYQNTFDFRFLDCINHMFFSSSQRQYHAVWRFNFDELLC